MDYHHPFFSSEDISIPIPNPGQHPSAPVEMLRRENYHRNSIMAVSSYAQPPSISPVEDTEELDTSSRPRLTQEQIATLEENFRQRPKPGTDFKKHLASQIGLSIQRVNNWYQNRRAKARHQKPQERSFDVLPLEPDDSPWAVPNIPFLNFQHDEDGYHDLSRQLPPSDLMSITDNGLVQVAQPASPDVDSTRVEPGVGPATTTVVSTHDGFGAEADSIFVNGENDFSHLNGGWPLMPDWDISNWVADIPMDPPCKNEEMLEYGAPADASAHQMYPYWAQGFDAANSSCQTFFSTSSSDGDARVLTPPPKTSPMPTLPPELEVRRGSSSSDLAKNLDTIRLQQPRSRTGLRDEVFCSPPSSADAGAVLERPPTSDPQGIVTGAQPGMSFGGVGKPSPVPRIDLASRRKRPRPAALRPDSQRSHSCTAPLTLSPHAQVSSSMGIGAAPSVRRIRSTGQNLNATGGGVQKPGLRSAQLSPRNLQSFLGATGMRIPSPNKGESTSPIQAPASHGKPPTPLTPGKVDVPSELWPNVAPYLASPVFPWQANDQTAPFAPAAGPVISSPPITPFNVDASQMFPFERQQDPSYPYPPQSAPPEQTSFVFGDSPPVAPAGNHSVWQVPSSGMPGGAYSEDSTMALGRQTQMPPFNFSRLHYHPMGARQPYSHGPPHLASGRSAFMGNRPAPPKEIEIQVNLIPKPQGVAQTRKQYTFNHTTPKDFVYAS